MSDGASQGVMPERALGTILGDEEQPTEEEQLSSKEFEAKVRSASLDVTDSYDGAALGIARVIVEAIEKYPSLRSVPMEADFLRDATGEVVWDGDNLICYCMGLYDILKKIHPDKSSPERQVMDGMTGFMWGWAYNAAARILGLASQPNPAIMEIG